MKALIVNIIRFISDDQPGFVECQFLDAWNTEHIFQEKVTVVSNKDLDADSEYPQLGNIACTVTKTKFR